MPTYQYRCTGCGEWLEVVQTFSDEPLTTCPVCTGQLRKVFSAVGVVFKGSGFYKTDSRGAAKPRRDAADGKPEKKAETGSDAAKPGEAKPAAEGAKKDSVHKVA